ncbi:hypothetical protein J23TS9_29300 [Paenibacillus sp. J23TS9]|uniref:GerAB/ArcD/ProY family transporter n=1 Tax=Paenibacillus sp. J23TS9 TaxID=2807193 RepID=UPI001B008445|nr:GerAB/ArcD/ProY family transporter [Paenibacillus sp. J23TS9]GIP27800.1 hypothetical protein J23TS9_29300 [Paenibacillus sp. J23TS9]
MKQAAANPQISMPQYFILQIMVFGAISFYLYPYFIINATNQSYWIPILIWMMLGLLGAWLFSRMMALHQGMDAFAITKQELGWPGMILFILPMMWFIWRSMIIMIRAHTEIISMTILHTTPQWCLNGVILISVFLAMGGLVPIVRTAGVFFLVSLPLSFALTLLGLSDIHLYLGKPWIHTNGDFITSSKFYASSCIWLGYLYYAASGKYTKKPGKLWKPYMIAAVCFLPLIAGSVYLPVLTFSAEMSRNLALPYISKMDSVNHYWLIVENLTAVFISASMLYLILVLSLMLHCFVTALKTMLPSWNEKLLYLLIGAATYASTFFIISWNEIVKSVEWDSPFRLYLMFLFPLAVIIKSFMTERMKSRS